MWVYLKQNYPEIRNILGLHGSQSIFLKWCLPNIINASFRRLIPRSQFFTNLYVSPTFFRRIKFHVFNGIMVTASPWMSTFETTLPRQHSTYKKWQLRISLFLLSRDSCKAIIAISKRAIRMQHDALTSWSSQGLIDEIQRRKIIEKMVCVPPPQDQISQPRKRADGEVLRIIFVGNLFFLKGGREAYHACHELIRDCDVDLELVVISSLESDAWFSKTTKKEEEEWNAKLERSHWVTLKQRLSNNEVLNEMARCHLAIFPTKRDSYGYFTLEAQACGLPVITSDFGVQPEINSEDCGWIVPASLNAEVEDETLVANLKSKIILAFEEKIRFSKAQKAYSRIGEFHNYAATDIDMIFRCPEVVPAS